MHGRAHLQCVSVFGPELGWKAGLNAPGWPFGDGKLARRAELAVRIACRGLPRAGIA